MKTHEISFTTEQSVDSIKHALQGAIGKAEVGPIRSEHGGLLDAGPRPAVEIVIEKRGLGGVGAVQVYVFDHDAHREVTLVALGDGGLSRAIGGARATASLGKSVKMAEAIAAALR